ncbi:MAG: hypothetical protein AAF206_17530 [Bacteroidota bacterium]
MQQTSSTLKILKASWGIHISVEGQAVKSASKRFALDLAFDFPKLSMEEMMWLQKGFNRMVRPVFNKSGHIWQVSITSLGIIPTDYQEEGLYYAMALWMAEHFELDLPDFPCHFDARTNRYVFPELDQGI